MSFIIEGEFGHYVEVKVEGKLNFTLKKREWIWQFRGFED